mgnify:CR=1 FL=1
MDEAREIVAQRGEYKYGFVSDIQVDKLPPGLDESVVRFISAKKGEPEWLLEWRLKAFRAWQKMTEPEWPHVTYEPIDYQAVSYWASPKSDDDKPKSLDEVDPEILATFEKLGIPLHERAALAGVAVDVVLDSTSVTTTFKEKLAEAGIRPTIPLADDTPAGVIALEVAPGQMGYWIGLQNFYALMSYNPRTFYAMSVFELSEAIANHDAPR